MRKPFVAGNWKMNTDSQRAVALAQGIAAGVKADQVTVAVCPPFVYLQAAAEAVSGSSVAEGNGAFTGEISTDMLKDVGSTYVLCGHSERRHVIGETDALINKKLKASLAAGLLPILCIGELLEQRDADETESVCEVQLKEGLAGVTAAQMASVTIAYEPVWAIGTGKTATSEQAQEVHHFLRSLIEKKFGNVLAKKIRIQYGGSVKPANILELMNMPDVDGALVGGASLNAETFSKIVRFNI